MGFITRLFRSPRMSPYISMPTFPPFPPFPAPPDAGAPEIAEAREIQRKIAASRRGNMANWLTGPTGLRALATVAHKMLLGR